MCSRGSASRNAVVVSLISRPAAGANAPTLEACIYSSCRARALASARRPIVTDFGRVPEALPTLDGQRVGRYVQAMALTHFDSKGRAVMVDVSDKAETERLAIARGRVTMRPATLKLILAKGMKKGDVLTVAQLAGIAGAKRTPDLVPLCHPLALTSVKVELTPVRGKHAIDIEARVKTTGRTGVEMEALTAVTVAALTVYDMCKAVDRDMVLSDIRLEHKSGGKSGTWRRKK